MSKKKVKYFWASHDKIEVILSGEEINEMQQEGNHIKVIRQLRGYELKEHVLSMKNNRKEI